MQVAGGGRGRGGRGGKGGGGGVALDEWGAVTAEPSAQPVRENKKCKGPLPVGTPAPRRTHAGTRWASQRTKFHLIRAPGQQSRGDGKEATAKGVRGGEGGGGGRGTPYMPHNWRVSPLRVRPHPRRRSIPVNPQLVQSRTAQTLGRPSSPFIETRMVARYTQPHGAPRTEMQRQSCGNLFQKGVAS
jgi:hypothetical protein